MNYNRLIKFKISKMRNFKQNYKFQIKEEKIQVNLE